ncbi:DUF3775 domain-containing protein [Breoghania sp. L-A4]|uniref:DUF3775 domain-containing protein n=1 Tax=Breoghania sp. L-A4 TaxID=2304600 RepID=UPI000E35E97C|nr:DUF3775 domain-containing protein [Breoghania sp. L-A4]AXS41679.1 DUF3775 domain-containing protein [Breoghania sp. L-A4]
MSEHPENTQSQEPDADDGPVLSISPEQVCFLIVKAREYDAKEGETDIDSGSNAADDRMIDVLDEGGDDPVEEEIISFIDAMNEDEQIDLVTIARLGRGDGTLADWDELREEAAGGHNDRTAQYLLGIPLLPDYLENGLGELGHSCEEFETGRL